MMLATLLLAGGESRRMGRDKALLELAGVPLWRRQLDLLRALTPQIVLVSARVSPCWLPEDAIFVPDGPTSRGPLTGLAAGLRATHEMGASHLLALPVDMPAMSPGHLREMWGAASPACGVASCFGDRLEPLPAIFPAAAAPAAEAALAGGDVSITVFARALLDLGLLKVHPARPSDLGLYVNCNSPADWSQHVHS